MSDNAEKGYCVEEGCKHEALPTADVCKAHYLEWAKKMQRRYEWVPSGREGVR